MNNFSEQKAQNHTNKSGKPVQSTVGHKHIQVCCDYQRQGSGSDSHWNEGKQQLLSTYSEVKVSRMLEFPYFPRMIVVILVQYFLESPSSLTQNMHGLHWLYVTATGTLHCLHYTVVPYKKMNQFQICIARSS